MFSGKWKKNIFQLSVVRTGVCSHMDATHLTVRDGPLENLWGGEGNFRAAGIFFRYQNCRHIALGVLVGLVPGSNPPPPPPRNSLPLTLLLPLPFSHTYRRTLYPLYLLLLACLLGWTDRYNTWNLPVISTAIRCVLNTEMKYLPDPGLNSVFTVVSFSCFRQMSALKNLTCLLLGIFYETTLWWVRRWKIGTERSNQRKAKIKSSRT